jgi:hypothetical protein
MTTHSDSNHFVSDSSTESAACPEWVAVAEAARIVGRSPGVVRRLAARGLIRIHRPPGCIARYYVADLEKLSPAAALAGSAG